MSRPGTPPDFEWGALDERVLREIRRRGVSRPEAAPDGRVSGPRRVPRLAWAAAALAATLIVALVTLTPWRGDDTAIPPISALEAPATAESDRVAALVSQSQRLEGLGIRTEGLRQLVVGDSGMGFVAPASADAVCVFYSAGQGILGSSCGARERLATAPIGVEVIEGPRLIFVGVVPDGYAIAQLGDRHAPIEGNGFLLEVTSGSGLVQVLGLGLPDLQAPVGEPRSR